MSAARFHTATSPTPTPAPARRSPPTSRSPARTGNYQLTIASASTTATIDKRNVTASITAADKTYDGTDDASITSCTLEAQNGKPRRLISDDVAARFQRPLRQRQRRHRQDGHRRRRAHRPRKATTSCDPRAPRPTPHRQRNVTASITAADKTYDGTDAASISGCTLEAQTATTASSP
jgi:hypothetical protein